MFRKFFNDIKIMFDDETKYHPSKIGKIIGSTVASDLNDYQQGDLSRNDFIRKANDLRSILHDPEYNSNSQVNQLGYFIDNLEDHPNDVTPHEAYTKVNSLLSRISPMFF